jgi:hypothetical protein
MEGKGYGPGLREVIPPGPMQSAKQHYDEARRLLGRESKEPNDIMIAAFMITAALDYLASCTIMAANIKNDGREDV